jgi:sterol desaturase/sphingolipid hydroxylase (fatty acid hydroxylase superfamily)
MISETIIANKALIGAAAFGVLFVAERLRAASPTSEGWRRLFRNGVLWACLLILSPLIVLPLTAFAAEHALWRRPAAWPYWAALIADMILLDLWSYLLHRSYHEIGAFWRFHRVHHLDNHLDTTSAVRFHPGEVALSALLRIVPITLLAIPFADVVLFEAALLTASIFHHSNLRLPAALEGLLSRIIVTPSIHWVHHHAVRRDTNSNYAAILSAWDPIFGTRSATKRAPGMKIGVEGARDLPIGLLLVAPFKRHERYCR